METVKSTKDAGISTEPVQSKSIGIYSILRDSRQWMYASHLSYVWSEKVKNGNNYTICVDKLRGIMMQEYQQNQFSLNPLAFIPLTDSGQWMYSSPWIRQWMNASPVEI